MKIIIALIVLCLPAMVLATPITYDLRAPGIEAIDEVNSFSLSQDGLTTTLTAFPTTYNEPPVRDVVLNQTASSFGINVVGTTCGGSENSSQIDGGCAGEFVTISFSQNVLLNNLKVSSFGSSDSGRVTIGSTNINILSTGTHSLGDVFLSAGDTFSLAWIAGNGFSFDSFTVSTVPEPSTLLLLGFGLAGIAALRRKFIA